MRRNQNQGLIFTLKLLLKTKRSQVEAEVEVAKDLSSGFDNN